MRFGTGRLGLVVAALVAAGPALAAVVSGRVTDERNGSPVSWASVELAETGLGAAADSLGRYVIANVPPGDYLVMASAVGFAPETRQLSVRGIAATADFRLRPQAVEMGRVEVRAGAPVRNLGDGPVPTRVVTQQSIEQKGAADLQEALRAEPGCKVASCCPVSGAGEVQLQGLPGKYTSVVLDGMPGLADLGCYGLAHVPVSNVERVEVATGAGGLSYGGDAFGGVINVVPRQVTRTGGSVHADGGSYGTANLQATVDAGLEGLDATATLSRRQTGASDANGDGVSDFAASNQSGLTARLRLRPHPRFDVTVSGHSWSDERQGGSMERIAGRSNEGLYENPNISSWGPMAVARWQAGPAARLTGRGSYSAYRQRVYSREQWFKAFEEVGYADLQFAGDLPLAQRLTVTLSQRLERVTENTSVGPRSAARTGLVAEDEVALGPVTLAGIGRLEHHSQYGARFMPGLSALYSPVEFLRLRGSAGTGFKSPPLFSKQTHFCAGQEMSEFIQNPDLLPERSRNGNLSAELRWIDLALSVMAYRSDISDMVADSMVGHDTVRGVRQYQQFNRGAVVTQGVDVGAAWRPVASLRLQAGYALLDARDIAAGTILPYRSTHAASWSAGYSFERIGLDASLSGEFVGSMATQQREGERLVEGPRSPDYTLWHARLAKRFGRAESGTGWEVFAAARNLFDFVQTDWLQQDVPLWAPTRGRWLSAGVKLSF